MVDCLHICEVVSATWGFDLKVGVSLETNVFFTLFLYAHPAVYKWVVSLDKARGTIKGHARSVQL